MKEIIRDITPPVIWKMARRIKGSLVPKPLFEGSGGLFASLARDCKSYGEYGVGQSTIWISKNTNCSITSVDTSQDWITIVSEQLSGNKKRLIWVDVGDLSDWGTPVSYTKRGNFLNYISAPWASGESPDFVLVDGRFRISSFLYSIASARPGAKILFDDYTNRPVYHVVEEFLKPVTRTERQALFIVPEMVDKEAIKREALSFLMVFD